MKLQLTAAAALAALVLAAPGLAKGPSEAKISGPGLKGGGIVLKSDGGGDPGSGTPLGDLADQSGFWPLTFGQEPDPTVAKQPKATLGPRYTVAYRVPGPENDTATLRQDLYPYAQPAPLAHMAAGQSFFNGNATRGGWYQATQELKKTLVDAGLPPTPPGSSSGGDWKFAVGTSGIAAIALLLGVAFIAARRRPRTARA